VRRFNTTSCDKTEEDGSNSNNFMHIKSLYINTPGNNMGNHSDKISSKEITFLRMHTIFEKKEIKDFYKDFLVSI
jgi:hypothetical protein